MSLPSNILAAEGVHYLPPHLDPKQYKGAELTLVLHSRRFVLDGLPKEFDKSTTLKVIVNEGRWLALCPWCSSAEYAARSDHRFMCTHCHNQERYVWIKTQWPKGYKELEQMLTLRPVKNAHWVPGETLSEVAVANEAHGIATFAWFPDVKPPKGYHGMD